MGERMLRMRALALVCVMAISLTCLSVPDYEFDDAGEPVVWERTKAPATDPMNFGVTKSISKSISKLKFHHHAPKPKLPKIPRSGKHHHKFHLHRRHHHLLGKHHKFHVHLPGQKKFLPKIKLHKTRSFGIKKRSFGIKKRSFRSKTRHLSIKIPKIPRIPHSLGRPTKLGDKKRKTRTSAKPKEKKSKKEKAAKKLAAAKAKEKCAKEKKKKKAAKKKAKEVKTKERTKKNRKLRASEQKAKSLLKEKSNKLRFAKKETKQEKLLVRKVKAKCERRVKHERLHKRLRHHAARKAKAEKKDAKRKAELSKAKAVRKGLKHKVKQQKKTAKLLKTAVRKAKKSRTMWVTKITTITTETHTLERRMRALQLAHKSTASIMRKIQAMKRKERFAKHKARHARKLMVHYVLKVTTIT